MATPKELYYAKRGEILVKNLQSRHFEAYYCATRQEALAKALENRWQMYNRQLEELEEAERRGEVLVIRPEADLGVGRIEKDRLRLAKAYRQGYLAAAAKADELAEYLG